MDELKVSCLLNRLKAQPGMLEYLSMGIIHTWNERMFRGDLFTRWRDDDKSNASDANIRYCAIHDVIQHIDDWTTDWDTGLSEDQRDLVKTTNWVDAVCHAPDEMFCTLHARQTLSAMTIRFKTGVVSESAEDGDTPTTDSVIAASEHGAPGAGVCPVPPTALPCER